MELRDLRSFAAVARLRSFSAAARELGYAQSAVSQHVAALEADLGSRLLDRRPVALTPAGTRLLEHATRILLHADVARSELAGARDDRHVRVATTAHAAPDVLAAGLRVLRREAPALSVDVLALAAGDAVEALARGAVDLALVDGAAFPTDPLAAADAALLATTLLREVPVVIALAATHPLAGRAALALTSVADAPWVAAPALDIGLARALAGTARPLTTPVAYDGRDLRLLLALVAAGHGLALLPAGSVPAGVGVATVPVASPALVHRTELLTLRAPSAAARSVAAALRAAAA